MGGPAKPHPPPGIVAAVTADHVARLRREYEAAGLDESSMAEDPIVEFESWFNDVVGAGIEEPNAFVLATATLDGRPSARALLMKEYGPDGFVFYTSITSRKAEELAVNPRAAAVFVWVPVHRQVRIEGSAHLLSDAEADSYFATRPRGAQLAAHASPQSRVVASRTDLESEFSRLEEEFADREIPRPEEWGGYRLWAEVVEFWQGRPNRFHDRVRYVRADGGWRKERLAP